MTVHGKSLTKHLRLLLAGFMAVWLSGVVFLLCCGQMNGRTEEAAASGSMGAMTDHCDKARQKAADSLSHGSDSAAVRNLQTGHVGCCGFLTVVFDKIRKVEKDRQNVAAVFATVSARFQPPDDIASETSPLPASYGQPFVIPEKLFIRNCVFLI